MTMPHVLQELSCVLLIGDKVFDLDAWLEDLMEGGGDAKIFLKKN